ncbi:MAG: FtsX-like permease family protein, partial [Clostridia bacterium]|nr:FtsX-like permease family protein [Clostridia bacterium]
PTFVKVYTATYDQKLGAGDYIKDWNTKHKGSIGYFDTSEMFIYNLLLVIDLVSIILIAVASISLVVSTVMIGVITSNSVVERTREIGILRSLGARRTDIRNVFIAETSLIGLSGGIIGIVITYILCPIISLVIGAISGVGSLLHFHPLHALALVAISLVLTVISGIVPAIGASRKNVVDALRVD